MNVIVSQMDMEHFAIIRRNVTDFIQRCAEIYDEEGKELLDIAPQDYEGAKAFFRKCHIHTLDINPSCKADYLADICEKNEHIIPAGKFDFVLCTEVLEHVLNPFKAIDEIYRILACGGFLFISAPFNFRIHGPLPDCWRFTEHGLRELLKRFLIIHLLEVPTRNRDLMPIHYTAIAQKP